MHTKFTPGTRVKHRLFGEGTIVPHACDFNAKVNYNELKIASINFDSLPKGYSNPFITDWEALSII